MTTVTRLRPKAITAPHHRGSTLVHTFYMTLMDTLSYLLSRWLWQNAWQKQLFPPPCSHLPSTGIIDTHFHVHWRLNLGTHACVTSKLTTEPSLQPHPLQPNILAALKLEFISIQQHLLIVAGIAFSLSGPWKWWCTSSQLTVSEGHWNAILCSVGIWRCMGTVGPYFPPLCPLLGQQSEKLVLGFCHPYLFKQTSMRTS